MMTPIAVGAGATTAIGALPHFDAADGIRFAFEQFGIPMLPLLPRRSANETPIIQAVAGVEGVSFGQYGSIAIDPGRLDPDAPIDTSIDGDMFGGLRAGVERLSEGCRPPMLAWQFAGPISVGVALMRAGAPAEIAFDVALAAVVGRVTFVGAQIAASAPATAQLVTICEPFGRDVSRSDFALTPDDSIDRLSSALVAAQAFGYACVRPGGDSDLSLFTAAGPSVLCVPSARAEQSAGLMARYLDDGGALAWGVVRTDGPLSLGIDADVRRMARAWSAMLAMGADLDRLRSMALMIPDGEFVSHDVSVATRVVDRLDRIASIVASPSESRRVVSEVYGRHPR